MGGGAVRIDLTPIPRYKFSVEIVQLCVLLYHLQFQLTDSAYLLPPNMRAISRFMNMSQWVKWGIDMIRCYETLSEKERDDYAFVMEYKPLFEELYAGIAVADYIENLLKKEGLSNRTAALCERHIILGLFGTPNNRLAALGFNCRWA